MSSPLESLPDEIIQKILILAAFDSRGLLRYELVSKTLHRVVQDDKTWEPSMPRRLYHEDERLATNRLKACMKSAFFSVRREQNRTGNVLLEELGAEGWINLVKSAVSRLLPLIERGGLDWSHDTFEFRGDTLYVLAELVQANLISHFEQANVMSCKAANRFNAYPVLGTDDFRDQDLCSEAIALGNSVGTRPHDLSVNGWIANVVPRENWVEFHRLVNTFLQNDSQDKIIRRLSHRAGIPRMDSAVFDLAWQTLVYVTMLLVQPACIELVEYYKELHSFGEKRQLTSAQTIRMVPPLSLSYKCNCCDDGLKYVHVPVPQQIENAARSLFGSRSPHKVYGDFWVIPGIPEEGTQEWHEAVESAIAAAEADYELEDEMSIQDRLDRITIRDRRLTSEAKLEDSSTISDDETMEYFSEDDNDESSMLSME